MLGILEKFPELRPFERDLNLRMERYANTRNQLLQGQAGLSDFANAHTWYGFHQQPGGWVYREWAPGADALYLTGDFNGWDWTAAPLRRLERGNWEIFLPGETLRKGSRVLTIVQKDGKLTQHIPLYARRVVQDVESFSWCCEVWDDVVPYPWTDQSFASDEPPLIYEAHVGMSKEDERIATYREFADDILLHILDAGYNTVQLMAIMEHPFYGSFGYQVSSFYAASSRCGTPDDLKYLVNRAHELGLRVLLDVVHSHAVGNTLEGINLFDGTDDQFFHRGPAGNHPAWGTRLFDYGKPEVLHFLLSNLKFWLEEYHFDGFRFDGVTSMLYHDHGLGASFTNLSQYYTMNTDVEAITYLQLANELVRAVNPRAMTIAEDVSGMPGMCEPIASGGIGFDYRLGMGLPDMWTRLVRDKRDEDWSMREIWKQLTFRNAPTIAYVESHDQALVGDQTLIFRMAGAEMYGAMARECHSLVIDRAIALHKLIRLLTLAAGGSGYLCFMGNEFGHPEWIDFPRPGNNSSFRYCRRQWSLMLNPFLKYQGLYRFDQQMVRTGREYRIYDEEFPTLTFLQEDDKVLAFERGGLVFVFNFSPEQDFRDCPIPVSRGGDYRVLFTSDDECFDGFARIAHETCSASIPGREGSWLRLYLPPRTCMVLEAAG